MEALVRQCPEKVAECRRSRADVCPVVAGVLEAGEAVMGEVLRFVPVDAVQSQALPPSVSIAPCSILGAMVGIERLKCQALRQRGADVEVEIDTVVSAVWICSGPVQGQSDGARVTAVGVAEIQKSWWVRQVDDLLQTPVCVLRKV